MSACGHIVTFIAVHRRRLNAAFGLTWRPRTPPSATSSARSHDKGRNRAERRAVTVFDPANKLADTEWHPHVATIIRVERDVYTRNAQTGLLRHSAETGF